MKPAYGILSWMGRMRGAWLGCALIFWLSGCGDTPSVGPDGPAEVTEMAEKSTVASDSAPKSTASRISSEPISNPHEITVTSAVQQPTEEQTTASDLTADVAATDWLFFRGDFAGRGYVKSATLPEKLDVVWEYWEPKCSYETSPVVCDGRVVTTDLDGMVRCLQLSDKKLLWKTPTKFGFTASPSIRNGKIYVGDNDGKFRRLDLATGAIDWEYQANAQIDSAANFQGDHVIFGSQDANVYSLNTADGSLAWKHTIDDQVRCSIVVDAGRTAVAGCDAMLHVIDANNGTGLAKIELSSQTAVAPAMVGPLAYFGMENGEFVCAHMEEKKILWTWKDERQEASIRGSASVADDVVVFGNRGNRVVCLDRMSGEVRWTYRAKRSVESSVLIVGERVYVGDTAGNFMVLGLKDGNLLQNIELSGGITSAPCLSGNRLLVATQEGIVYCLGATDK
ncbi:MAG: PQQ-binding-like beta-propeller repeat protein [Planctomycetaceae bacterium]|nr:PQQ-binding-like beta-propeller repeat protein [Planctomycetaceae bacterium]